MKIKEEEFLIIKDNLIKKFEEAKNTFSKYTEYDISNMKLPSLSIDLKGAVAGQALSYENKIRLNYELINKGYFKEISEATLYHELAHLITDFLEKTKQLNSYTNVGNLIKNKPHGQQWKFVMNILGEEPSTTHSMEVNKRKYWRIEYICNCDTSHMITKKKHEQIQRKMAVLTCRKCDTILKLKDGANFKKC